MIEKIKKRRFEKRNLNISKLKTQNCKKCTCKCKCIQNVPARPVILNCVYYTENISAFLDFQLQPLAQAVKLYVKDTCRFENTLLFAKITW